MRNLYPRLRMRSAMSAAAIAACLLMSSCSEQATLPIAAGMGPDPVLPAPRITLLPTINIAPARGWNGDSRPAAAAGLDVLTGFVNTDGEAQGRPVGVAINKRGALLIADDVGNVVWRATAQR